MSGAACLAVFSWWRLTDGATRLGVWTRPPALHSPWREPGVGIVGSCMQHTRAVRAVGRRLTLTTPSAWKSCSTSRVMRVMTACLVVTRWIRSNSLKHSDSDRSPGESSVTTRTFTQAFDTIQKGAREAQLSRIRFWRKYEAYQIHRRRVGEFSCH